MRKTLFEMINIIPYQLNALLKILVNVSRCTHCSFPSNIRNKPTSQKHEKGTKSKPPPLNFWRRGHSCPSHTLATKVRTASTNCPPTKNSSSDSRSFFKIAKGFIEYEKKTYVQTQPNLSEFKLGIEWSQSNWYSPRKQISEKERQANEFLGVKIQLEILRVKIENGTSLPL